MIRGCPSLEYEVIPVSSKTHSHPRAIIKIFDDGLGEILSTLQLAQVVECSEDFELLQQSDDFMSNHRSQTGENPTQCLLYAYSRHRAFRNSRM